MDNRLVMDLGGLHEVATGAFTLDGAGIATVEREGPPGSALTLAQPIEIDTQMELGGIYEAVLFHAERHECGSNFKLTLAGFDKPRSVCDEVCGDGVTTRSETCDDGELNGTGYGLCGTDCEPGPRCGDALVNGDEACDNGLNVDRYSNASGACAPGCVLPSSCGDSVVDPSVGEQCDDGVNDNAYGGCTDACKLGPRCGDGEVNGGGEECDDRNRTNGDGCNLNCRLERLR
jgi:cysteine-rich repeat protein